MKKEILAIFAHPDDEILACGGTLIKRVSEGFNINILILSNGCESRSQSSQNEINHRLKSCEKASEIIGANLLKVGEFPDNKFDSIPLLDIVKYIERNVKDIKPDEIFTHFRSDLNIDHRITFQAVKTVFRPFFMKENSKIFECEVPSSTDWTDNFISPFSPNHYEDISLHIKKKIEALNCYNSEMRDPPHSRSYESIQNLAKFRGMHSGSNMSEAFIINFSKS